MANGNKNEDRQKKINVRFLSVTAVFLVLVALVVAILLITDPNKDQAADDKGTVEPENKYGYAFAGAGTEDAPYLISNVEDLCLFRDLVNSGNTFSGLYFMQTDNIDLSGIGDWTPIGKFGSGNYFYGSYNGDGYTISDLTITGSDNSALFGMLHGEVRNLGIESGHIEGWNAASIACHGAPTASVVNCYNKAAVHGSGWAGGIAVDFPGRISFCWNLGEITCDTTRVAGISAYNAQIEECYSYNMPVVSDLHNGGISGSQEFENFDDIDWIDKLHLKLYEDELHRDASGKYTKQLSYIVKDGDTVSFKRHYTPSAVVKSNIKRFLSNYGAVLILVPGALVMIIIAIRKPAARGTMLSVLLVLVGFNIINNITLIKRGDGLLPMLNYYQQDGNSVDVLMLGSSRAGMNQDCEVLWEDYGISGYALWGGIQPAWNSYYYFNEALKMGTPKVVVMDIVTSTYDIEYSTDAWQYQNTFGMKLSLDKFEAIQSSSPQESWMDMLFGLPIHHTRYSELKQGDFEIYHWSDQSPYYKGTTVRYGNAKITTDDIEDVTTIAALSQRQEAYLVKIIDRCKKENIPLVLVASYMPNRLGLQSGFNYIDELADKYDIPFINYNLLNTEIGLSDDDFYMDGDRHLNTNGARKQSIYLGQYLKEHYNLTDHRGNSYYSSWDEFAVRQQNAYIPQITGRSDYLKELIRDDRTAVIIKQSVNGSDPAYEAFKQDAANCGFDMSFLDSVGKDCWVVEHPENSFENTVYELGEQLTFQLGDEEMSVNTDGTVTYAGEKITTLRDGITCIVYDPNTKQIIDKCLIFDPSKSVVKEEEPQEPIDPHQTIAHI